MIAANVAAAETLSKRRQPCLYRVHDEPQRDKLAALRTFLATLDLRLAKGQVIKPVLFNRILAKAAGTPQAHLINTVVLRAQSQAIYAPDNIGHFGLALTKYVHFTSPIRRYADLVAHRGLLAALDIPGAGAADKGPDDAADLAAVGQHISMTERRSMTAERDALDRFMAATMMKRVGDTFMGRIDGVTHFGLFVELDETGADGLIPISAIGDDYYTHDESRHALVGRRGKRIFRLGDRVEVRLLEADPLGRGLRLELADQPPGAKPRTSGRVPARGPGRGTSGGRPPRKR
jgi:ribonuclease R